ncbi:MAG: toll/interleukin-1 receptor domain-containing protein [Planctomycetota bacterium]|jgi:hypothetical protein
MTAVNGAVKPTVFFSHASADAGVLTKLRDAFIKKTGGAIDVFLTSDGQSVPFGRNWVSTLKEALDRASLAFVFLTPNAMRSDWVQFESGYMHAREVQVVPIGLLGLDLSHVDPPLGLLQGFNIRGAEGLNNLIAVANQTFGHSHGLTFAADDYSTITAAERRDAFASLGELSMFIESVAAATDHETNTLLVDVKDVGAQMGSVAASRGVEHQTFPSGLHLAGMTMEFRIGKVGQWQLVYQLDPTHMDVTVPLVEEHLGQVTSEAWRGTRVTFYFDEPATCLRVHFKITGRLAGTGVTLAEEAGFVYRDYEMRLDRRRRGTTYEGFEYFGAYVSLTPRTNAFDISDAADLLRLLAERGVLYYD